MRGLGLRTPGAGVLSGTGESETDLSAIYFRKLLMPSQAGRKAGHQWVDASNRNEWTPIVGPYWMRTRCSLLASGGWQPANYAVYTARKPVNDDGAGITYGGAWDSFPVAGALGNTTRRSQVTGEYAEFTVTGTTEAYLSITRQANCGYGWVTINGGTLLANGSGLVDDGAGHRYFDGYAAAQTAGQRVQVATGLDPRETYTIRVTHSGEKAPEATDHRVYFEGYVKDAYQIDDNAGLAVETSLVLQLGVSGSAMDYAYSYRPTGAANYEFTGSVHLNEAFTAVAWKDGEGNNLVVDAETSLVTAEKIVLSQSGTARHSETGETGHASVEFRVTFDHQGIEIYHDHAWLSAASIYAGYVAMLPSLPAWSTEGAIVGAGAYDLTENDDAYKGQAPSRLGLIWSDSGPWVAWLYLPDLNGVNHWGDGGSMAIQDTAVNNKLYVNRVPFGATGEVSPGDRWESTHRIFVTYAGRPENLP